MVNTIAFAGGPILGSFIGERWGYDILFAIVSGIAVVSLALALLVRETKASTSGSATVRYIDAISQRQILVAASVILLVGLAHGGVMFYIPIYLKEKVRINIGLFFAIYGVSALLIRGVVGRLSDRYGKGPLLLGSLVLLTMGVISLSNADDALMMLIAATLYGLGFGSYQPTLTTLVADKTSDDTRGKIFSFYYGAFDLGISMAGIFLGTIAEHYGIAQMFLVASALTFGALLIFAFLIQPSLFVSLRFAFTLHKSS